MKKIILLFISVIAISNCIAQDDKSDIKAVDVKNLEGMVFNTGDINNDGKPLIIDFWATWCKPCIKELMAIDENYVDWQEETGVVVYAVSIDDSKSMSKVAPFVSGKGWEFEILLDSNEDFSRAMGVVNVPHTFIIDGNGKIVWQHTAYTEGDEEEMYEILLGLTQTTDDKKNNPEEMAPNND